MADLDRTQRMLQQAMDALVLAFPQCAIVLLVAPTNKPEGSRCNYVSSSNRKEMIILMKEVVARLEGRAADAPERRQ